MAATAASRSVPVTSARTVGATKKTTGCPVERDTTVFSPAEPTGVPYNRSTSGRRNSPRVRHSPPGGVRDTVGTSSATWSTEAPASSWSRTVPESVSSTATAEPQTKSATSGCSVRIRSCSSGSVGSMVRSHSSRVTYAARLSAASSNASSSISGASSTITSTSSGTSPPRRSSAAWSSVSSSTARSCTASSESTRAWPISQVSVRRPASVWETSSPSSGSGAPMNERNPESEARASTSDSKISTSWTVATGGLLAGVVAVVVGASSGHQRRRQDEAGPSRATPVQRHGRKPAGHRLTLRRPQSVAPRCRSAQVRHGRHPPIIIVTSS